MFKYKIRVVNSRRQLPEVVFEDSRYALIGEMLLAERSFLTSFLAALDSVLKDGETGNETAAGNAFSLFITKETTKITNDINGEEAEAPSKDLKKLIKAYQKQYDRIQR